MTTALNSCNIQYQGDAFKKFGERNGRFCDAINMGVPFSIVFVGNTWLADGTKKATFSGLEYALVVTANGDVLPFPLFEQASDTDFKFYFTTYAVPSQGGKEFEEDFVAAALPDEFEVSVFESWMRGHFGLQYRGHVDCASNKEAKRQGIRVAAEQARGANVIYLSTFGVTLRIDNTFPMGVQCYLYRGDTLSDVQFIEFLALHPHEVILVTGLRARELVTEFEVGCLDRMADWPLVDRLLKQLDAIKALDHYTATRDSHDLQQLIGLLASFA